MGYSPAEGKGIEELEAELRRVYRDYPEYSDPELGGGDFRAMAERFAGDEFYNLHKVAKRWLELDALESSAERPGRGRSARKL